MSWGQSFVHAKADEMTEPGKEGMDFQEWHIFPGERCCFLWEGPQLSLNSLFLPQRGLLHCHQWQLKWLLGEKAHHGENTVVFSNIIKRRGSLATSVIRKLISIFLIYQCLNLLSSQVLHSKFVFGGPAVSSSNPCSAFSSENGETLCIKLSNWFDLLNHNISISSAKWEQADLREL